MIVEATPRSSNVDALGWCPSSQPKAPVFDNLRMRIHNPLSFFGELNFVALNAMSNFLVIEGYSVDLPEFVDMVVTLLNYATIHKETPPGYVKNICAV